MHHSFYAMLGRMKYIVRWGLMRSAAPENLSEHTLEVAYLTHALIALGVSRLGRTLDPGQGVLYALYHDCSEILTGDLPTPVKYGNPNLKDAYREVERQAAARLLDKLPRDLAPAYAPWFEIPPEYAPYVKAADKLSALIKCLEEKKLGNSEFDTAAHSTLEAIHALELEEAEQFLREFLPAYSLTLDQL